MKKLMLSLFVISLVFYSCNKNEDGLLNENNIKKSRKKVKAKRSFTGNEIQKNNEWTKVKTNTKERFNKIKFYGSIGYAVADKGILFESLDWGENWYKVETGVTHNLRDISFSKDKYGDYLFKGVINGLFTDNDGYTWTKKPESNYQRLHYNFYETMVSSNLGSNRALIKRSNNDGKDWIDVEKKHIGNFTDFASNGTFIAATTWYPGNVFISGNRGLTWNRILKGDQKPAGSDLYFDDFLSVDFLDNKTVLVGGTHHILKSTNSGFSYKPIYETKESSRFMVSSHPYYKNQIAAATIGGEVLTSIDGGKTWKKEKATDKRLTSIAISSDYIVAVGEDGTIIRKKLF